MADDDGSAWSIETMTRAQAVELSDWRYGGEHAIYNRDVADVDEILDPDSGYLALLADGEFVGFCSFGLDGQVPGGRYDDSAVDVGIGLSPAHVGRGLGRSAVGAIIRYAATQHPDMALRATVAAFNLRSRRTFERAGFVEEGEFNGPTGLPFRQYRREPR
jgi:RimJ/RimL family protein N-acetyltransferase